MPLNVPRTAPSADATAAAVPAADDAPTPRQRRKLERPQELLDAALALFVEKGFAATRSEEVAQRAGVSKGTLYLYYPSKEELFKAVVRSKITNIIAEGMELVRCFEGSSAELLRTLMQVWWDEVGNTPAAGIHKIIVAEVRNFPELAQFYVDEVITPASALIMGALQRGIDSGEFRPVPLAATKVALIAPYMFLATMRHSIGACPVHGFEVMPEQVLETHLELMLRGLAPEPSAVGVAAGVAAGAAGKAPKKKPAVAVPARKREGR